MGVPGSPVAERPEWNLPLKCSPDGLEFPLSPPPGPQADRLQAENTGFEKDEELLSMTKGTPQRTAHGFLGICQVVF